MYSVVSFGSTGRALVVLVSEGTSIRMQNFKGQSLPYPCRVAGNPAFRKRDQLCFVPSGFGDQVTRLFNGCLKIKPDRLSLRHCDAHGSWGRSVHF